MFLTLSVDLAVKDETRDSVPRRIEIRPVFEIESEA